MPRGTSSAPIILWTYGRNGVATYGKKGVLGILLKKIIHLLTYGRNGVATHGKKGLLGFCVCFCTSESIWRQCSRHSRLMAELGRGSAPSEEMVKSEYHLSFPVLIALCRPCVQSSCMASTSEASGDTSRSFCMTLKKGRGQTRCAPTSSASNAFIFLAMRTTEQEYKVRYAKKWGATYGRNGWVGGNKEDF